MIVQGSMVFKTTKEAFLKMAEEIIVKWHKSTPEAGHENDKILVLGTVNGTLHNELVLVTPQGDETLETCGRKYLRDDYTVSDATPAKFLEFFK